MFKFAIACLLAAVNVEAIKLHTFAKAHAGDDIDDLINMFDQNGDQIISYGEYKSTI